jgi:hypothetical protein
LIGKIEGKKLQLENQINDIQQMIGDLEKVRQRCKLELKK